MPFEAADEPDPNVSELPPVPGEVIPPLNVPRPVTFSTPPKEVAPVPTLKLIPFNTATADELT